MIYMYSLTSPTNRGLDLLEEVARVQGPSPCLRQHSAHVSSRAEAEHAVSNEGTASRRQRLRREAVVPNLASVHARKEVAVVATSVVNKVTVGQQAHPSFVMFIVV